MWIYIICVLCLMAAAAGITGIILYKRQIGSICRQIKFLNENDSNILITRDLSTKEINELINALNDMLKRYREEKVEMQEKDARLKDTITNISHDIRTPLTSLNGYFELLKETEKKEEQERYAVIIKERIRCLKDMLEQLFTYVKLQNGAYRFELEEVDVSKELSSILVEFYEEFKKKNVEPQILISEEQVILELNKMAFHRIFENIIKNAVEHGEGYFRFEMRTENEKIYITAENDIRNGEEIEADKIFERFYKADKSRSQTSTGLGLAIAHDMVCKMGGNIRAEIVNGIFMIEVNFDFKGNL